MSDKNNSGLEVVAAELLSKLSVASAVIGNLPEMPGYNGSVLTIDDTEAAQIVKDLDEVRDALVRLSDAEAALAAKQVPPLSLVEIRQWWASENGLEDCDMCKFDDFVQVVRAVEYRQDRIAPKPDAEALNAELVEAMTRLQKLDFDLRAFGQDGLPPAACRIVDDALAKVKP